MKGKALHNIVDFIFFLLKNIVRLAAVGVIGVFILLILAVIMPDNAAAVVELLKNLKS